MTKIEIKGFENQEITRQNTRQQGASIANFSVPVNPENMTRTLKIEQDQTQSRGSSGRGNGFDEMKAEDLKFDFILDGTKTIEGYGQDLVAKEVSEQIELFLKTTYTMNGKTHRPNYLKIIWGSDFTFDCTLTSLNVIYTLFKPDGLPLRAKLSASFAGHTEPVARILQEDKNSPDLTHVRTVSDADKIFNKANEIYASPKFYMQVAQVNKLVNFRSLKNVSRLIFPPLAKNEENR